MIDSGFIIRYTNGLYSNTLDNSPTYEEFRDMFSSGQIRSKDWLVKELYKLNFLTDQDVAIVGSWFGTLGFMMKMKFPELNINLVDIDQRCTTFVNSITYEHEKGTVHGITGDMYDYDYTEDIIINTSCEHIDDVGSWLSQVGTEKTIVLQSNNFRKPDDHINCIDTIEEFVNQVSPYLKELQFAGELSLPMYKRFMIIGKTHDKEEHTL